MENLAAFLKYSTRASSYALLVCGSLACGVRTAPAGALPQGLEVSRVEAANETESALLRRLDSFPSGSPARLGEFSVVAAVPFSSASGRRCRSVTFSRPNEVGAAARLACSSGRDWFFVPAVLPANVAPDHRAKSVASSSQAGPEASPLP